MPMFENLFENFTERARKVMQLARNLAVDRQNKQIGTVHLLLGILEENGGVGIKALLRCGADLKQMSERLHEILPEADKIPGSEVVLSPGLLESLRLADGAALDMKQPVVDTGHLILGVWVAEPGHAQKIVDPHVITPEDLERAVREILSNENDQPAPALPQNIHPAPIPDKETAQRRIMRENPHLGALLPAIQSIMMWDEYYKFAMNGLLSSAESIPPEDVVKRAGELADLSMQERTKRDDLPPLNGDAAMAVPISEAAVAEPQDGEGK